MEKITNFNVTEFSNIKNESGSWNVKRILTKMNIEFKL